MAKRSEAPTSADVARMAGVSKWTVIRAFDPQGLIAADTRARVLEVANTLGYAPNLLARSLATRRSQQVAVLVDDFDNPYKLPTLSLLTAALQGQGILTTLININGSFDHLAALTDARQRLIDAVVLFGTAFTPETLAHARAGGGPPCYVLARDCDLPGVVSLHTDPVSAMQTMGAHLWERGHRRPVFLCGPRTHSTALGRRRAMRGFWADCGIAMGEIVADRYNMDTAGQVTVAALAEGPRPDVLICENDILAIGAMEALRSDLGLSVPGDIAVTGFDDIDIARMPSYRLTTWRQPVAEMVGLLVGFLTGQQEPHSVSLPGTFMQRGTA